MTYSLFQHLLRTAQETIPGGSMWDTAPCDAAQAFTNYTIHVAGISNAFSDEATLRSCWGNSLMCGLWARAGFPTIRLGHKTAASFMSTSIKPHVAEECVRAPWPAFAIRMPEPLLEIIDSNGEPQSVSVIMAASLPARLVRDATDDGGNRWWYKLFASSPADEFHGLMPDSVVGLFLGISLWGFNMTTKFLAREGDTIDDETWCRWDSLQLTGSDERTEYLARQLILSCCLYLSGNPEELAASDAPENKVRIRTRVTKASAELPSVKEWEIESAININFTPAVREFVKHGGSAPKVRTMVAGHWKRVPYGKGRALRRVQHILPYMRGPEGAPMGMRVK